MNPEVQLLYTSGMVVVLVNQAGKPEVNEEEIL